MTSGDNKRIIKSSNDALARYITKFVGTNFEVEAATYIEDARKRSEAMLADAVKQVEVLKKQAREEGYKAGFEQGQKEGLSAGLLEGKKSGDARAYAERAEETRKSLAQLSKLLSEVLRVFEGDHERVVRQAQAELLNLSMAVAEKVVLAALQKDRELIRRNVEEAIALCGRCTEIEVRAHPDSIKLLEEYSPEIRHSFDGLAQIHLLADTALRPGDATVKTRETEVRGLLLDKLREIYQALFFQPGQKSVPTEVFPPVEFLGAGPGALEAGE